MTLLLGKSEAFMEFLVILIKEFKKDLRGKR